MEVFQLLLEFSPWKNDNFCFVLKALVKFMFNRLDTDMHIYFFSYFITPSPKHRGTGYCFRSISLFISLFLCLQDYEKKAGPICMKFSGKVRSDHGTTQLHFWSIPRNRAMPRCATRGRGLLCFRTTACLFFSSCNKLFSSTIHGE